LKYWGANWILRTGHVELLSKSRKYLWRLSTSVTLTRLACTPLKFGEVPPVIKGVITVFVFQVLAPWWQSGESDLADSLARHNFAPSYITPPNMNPKSSVIQKLQSGRELNRSFCVFM
jgi:hypothetical protein